MNIIAIGGGDKEKAIEYGLSVARQRDVLLIPSACSTEASYYKKVPLLINFFAKYGLPDVQVLHDFGETPSKNKIEYLLGKAGLAYVIGGNSVYMLETIKSHGSDILLEKAMEEGLVLAGTSAGAILPFAYGQSNPHVYPEELIDWEYEYVQGLSIVDATIGVHANAPDKVLGSVRPKTRLDYFIQTALNYSYHAVAIENCAAIAIDATGAEVISSADGAAAHFLCKKTDGSYTKTTLYHGDKSVLIKK